MHASHVFEQGLHFFLLDGLVFLGLDHPLDPAPDPCGHLPKVKESDKEDAGDEDLGEMPLLHRCLDCGVLKVDLVPPIDGLYLLQECLEISDNTANGVLNLVILLDDADGLVLLMRLTRIRF